MGKTALGIVKYFYDGPSQPIGVTWFAVSLFAVSLSRPVVVDSDRGINTKKSINKSQFAMAHDFNSENIAHFLCIFLSVDIIMTSVMMSSLRYFCHYVNFRWKNYICTIISIRQCNKQNYLSNPSVILPEIQRAIPVCLFLSIFESIYTHVLHNTYVHLGLLFVFFPFVIFIAHCFDVFDICGNETVTKKLYLYSESYHESKHVLVSRVGLNSNPLTSY